MPLETSSYEVFVFREPWQSSRTLAILMRCDAAPCVWMRCDFLALGCDSIVMRVMRFRCGGMRFDCDAIAYDRGRVCIGSRSAMRCYVMRCDAMLFDLTRCILNCYRYAPRRLGIISYHRTSLSIAWRLSGMCMKLDCGVVILDHHMAFLYISVSILA